MTIQQRSFVTIILCGLALLSGSAFTHAATTNLLKNLQFEGRESDTKPALYWQYGGWEFNPKNSSVNFISEGTEKQVEIKQIDNAHSQLSQNITLSKGKLYYYSAKIKAFGTSGAHTGANIGILNKLEKGCDIKDGHVWHLCELYIDNQLENTHVALSLNLGHYGNLNRGRALFKEISLTEVDSIPESAILISYKQQTPQSNAKNKELPSYYIKPPKNFIRVLILLGLISVLLIGLLIYYHYHRIETDNSDNKLAE